MTRACQLFESITLSEDSKFLCGSDGITLAGLVAYQELGQLVYANLFDFAEFPRIQRWLKTMRSVPFHDDMFAYNIALGDIRTQLNTTKRYQNALAEGFGRLEELGAIVRTIPAASS